MVENNPSLRTNVIANYVGRLWSIASVYVFVPIYVRILGVDAFGLIAFYSVALAILFVADAGLSSSFAREAAREQDRARLLNLLVTIETCLFAIVGGVGLLMLLCAPLVAEHWLSKSGALNSQVTTDSVRLMAVALVPQITMSLYFGGLMGLQQQVRANTLSVLFGVSRSGLVVIPIFLWDDPRVFFLWQVIVSWGFLFVMRMALRKALGATPEARGSFSFALVRPIKGYALGMLALSVIAGLNTQMDRLIVSALRPITEFSYYALAATLSQIPTVMTMPIAMALLPRLTALRERQHHRELREAYERYTYMIAALSSAAAFTLIFFAEEMLALWMRGTPMPSMIVPVVQLLTFGGLFLALQLTPFQLSLANGHNKTNVRLGAVVLMISVPTQVLLISQFGLVGAAIPWLGINAFAFLYLGVVLNKMFYQGHPAWWFLQCTVPPVLISGVMLFGARHLAVALELTALLSVALAGVMSAISLALALALWPTLKQKLDDVA